MKDELKEKLLQVEKFIRDGIASIEEMLAFKLDESGVNKNFQRAVLTFLFVKGELQNMLDQLETAEAEYIKLEHKKFENIVSFPSWKNFSANAKSNELCKILSEDQTCAIISVSSNYLTARNKIKMLKYGYTELVCGKDNKLRLDERILLIHNITKSDVEKLPKELDISTLIMKNNGSWGKFCLDANIIEKVFKFKELDTDCLKDLFVAISNIVKPSNRAFDLYKVEPPRPSYFQGEEHYEKI